MIEKHFYEAPEAEILGVKFEKRFMVGSPDDDYSDPGSNPNVPGDHNYGGFN